MVNKKGFITLELIIYVIISLLLLSFISMLFVFNSKIVFKHEHNFNIAIEKLKQSIIIFKSPSKFSESEIEFNVSTKIMLKDNSLYETPGYLVYIKEIENYRFEYRNGIILLKCKYYGKNYSIIVFYDK